MERLVIRDGDGNLLIGKSLKSNDGMIYPYTVTEIMYFSNRGARPWIIETYGGFRFDNLDIGKTVFLTREEAEEALKEVV